MASSCGELVVSRGHARRARQSRTTDCAPHRPRGLSNAVRHLSLATPSLAALLLVACLVMAAPAGAQDAVAGVEATAPAPAEQVAQPDPAAPSPDPAPLPTDEARAAAPVVSERPAGSSPPAPVKPARSTAPSTGAGRTGNGSAAGSVERSEEGSSPAGGAGTKTAKRSSARADAPSRRSAPSTGSRASRDTSTPALTPIATDRAAATSSTDSGRTALAGLALLALALAGGCLAAALARAEQLGLRS